MNPDVGAVDAADAGGPLIPEPVFVLGIHECGGTLMHRMVAQVCALPGLNVPALENKQGRPVA